MTVHSFSTQYNTEQSWQSAEEHGRPDSRCATSAPVNNRVKNYTFSTEKVTTVVWQAWNPS